MDKEIRELQRIQVFLEENWDGVSVMITQKAAGLVIFDCYTVNSAGIRDRALVDIRKGDNVPEKVWGKLADVGVYYVK